jgi:hypothetical protein
VKKINKISFFLSFKTFVLPSVPALLSSGRRLQLFTKKREKSKYFSLTFYVWKKRIESPSRERPGPCSNPGGHVIIFFFWGGGAKRLVLRVKSPKDRCAQRRQIPPATSLQRSVVISPISRVTTLFLWRKQWEKNASKQSAKSATHCTQCQSDDIAPIPY